MKQPRWTPKHSVVLSLAVTYLGAAALLVMMFALPAYMRWYFVGYRVAPRVFDPTLAVFYACCPAGWAAIAALLRLLRNMRAERVFVPQNIKLLRLLSWCCVYVSVASFVAAWWYIPFALFFAAAGVLAILLRVIKNVMAAATRLREENDLTI